MLRGLWIIGAVCAVPAVTGCSQGSFGAGATGPDASTGPSSSRTVDGTNATGGNPGSSGTVVGSAAGSPSGAAVAASTGATNSNGTAGTCPSGYVVCDGVCMEASLMGPNCRPALCPAPPEGTTPPTRSALTARGFTWNVTTDSTNTTTLTYQAGPKDAPLSPTVAVDLNYRVNGVPALQTVSLTASTGGAFTWTTQTLKQGDDLDFYFHQTVATETLITGGGAPPPAQPLIDSMWFHQTIGQPPDPEPAYPLTATLAGRFRDRHPNEERYDHYVDTYFDGPVFALTLVDHGDSVDVTIQPTAKQIASDGLSKVDFKHYECFGSGMGGATPAPTPLCFTPPALSAIGVSMFYGDPKVPQGAVQTTVTNMAYGQLLDFELTFVGSRTYYTEFFEYYVGSGRLQPKVQHPWAHAAGDESITDVTTDQFGYAQHVPNISPTELNDFIAGKVLFEADFENQIGYNPPTTFDCPRGLAPGSNVDPIGVPALKSPIFTAGNSFTNMALATITRPGYTASTCFGCHHLDGKGLPPDENGAAPDAGTAAGTAIYPTGFGAMEQALLKLFSVSADGKSAGPDPTYGTILDQQAPTGTTPEVQASVTWQEMPGQFADGTPYSLRKPVLSTGSLRDGPLAAATHVSMRIPRPVFGLGFLEAVDEATILANADPNDANGDGIRGRPNWVTDPVTGAQELGRFGWKAGVASLREQAALALVNDMGITNPIYPTHRCGPLQMACLSAVNDAAPQLATSDLDHLESYMRGLSVPPRRNYDDPQAMSGQTLFAGIGCIKCHVANLVTGSTYPIAEMQNIDIQPFTDLLLHDMGPGLADDAPVEEGTAAGSDWRTCPLWGNGTGPSVLFPVKDAFDPNGDPPAGGVYLHDGRARSITEAILWHGGEAQTAHDLFVKMPASDRAALEAYVKYPFADPVPLRHCAVSTPTP
jgi:CxxC motif-containing protein (DUF1111 family)